MKTSFTFSTHAHVLTGGVSTKTDSWRSTAVCLAWKQALMFGSRRSAPFPVIETHKMLEDSSIVYVSQVAYQGDGDTRVAMDETNREHDGFCLSVTLLFSFREREGIDSQICFFCFFLQTLSEETAIP